MRDVRAVIPLAFSTSYPSLNVVSNPTLREKERAYVFACEHLLERLEDARLRRFDERQTARITLRAYKDVKVADLVLNHARAQINMGRNIFPPAGNPFIEPVEMDLQRRLSESLTPKTLSYYGYMNARQSLTVAAARRVAHYMPTRLGTRIVHRVARKKIRSFATLTPKAEL